MSKVDLSNSVFPVTLSSTAIMYSTLEIPILFAYERNIGQLFLPNGFKLNLKD